MSRADQPQLTQRQVHILAALADGLAQLGPALATSCFAPGCQRDATLAFRLGGVAGLHQTQLCTEHARQHVGAIDRVYVAPPPRRRPTHREQI
jgi:hypothetical protein